MQALIVAAGGNSHSLYTAVCDERALVNQCILPSSQSATRPEGRIAGSWSGQQAA